MKAEAEGKGGQGMEETEVDVGGGKGLEEMGEAGEARGPFGC